MHKLYDVTKRIPGEWEVIADCSRFIIGSVCAILGSCAFDKSDEAWAIILSALVAIYGMAEATIMTLKIMNYQKQRN